MLNKVLITGGTGFLGAYIIRELIEKGYAVRAIKRKSTPLPSFIEPNVINKVEWVEGDILDIIRLEVAMQGVDAVIHAAGKVSFHPSDKEALKQVNVDGTANVVNVALDNNIQRFIHISSVAAIGRSATGETVTEAKEWQDSKLNSAYAISKHKGEMEVWRGIGEGLNAVILNPSTILGYGNWNHSSAALFKNVYKGFPYYSTGINGFVSVEDVARIAVLLMETDITAEGYIVSAENRSYQYVFNLIADAFGKKRPSREATKLIGDIGWRLEALKAFFTGSKPLITKETALIARSNTYFDNNKLLDTLTGFRYTALEDVIESSCAAYKQSLKK